MIKKWISIASSSAGRALMLACGMGVLAEPAAGEQSERPRPCALAGTVTGLSGQPIAGARVEVVGLPVTAETTGGDGRFCLPRPEGAVAVQVLVSAQGFQPQTSPPVTLIADATHQVDVVLVRPFTEELTVTPLGGVGAAPPSASRGEVDAAQIASRALLRPGDILGTVPGIVMTQHSSGGHAPIILLRGYNLDHGTDFATFVDDVPLNLPSHAHAQGYTDLNFLINESIARIEFQKGPYAPQVGDFGTAGAANVILKSEFERPMATYEFGPYRGHRLLALGSAGPAQGRVVYGLDVSHNDGPNVVPDDFGRLKGMLRFSSGQPARNRTLALYAYDAGWTATDGYPQRALARGDITRFGTLDPSDGGRAREFLGTARWRRATTTGTRDVTAYARASAFDLFSNLTFWSRHPLEGDQIHQRERRLSAGLLVNGHVPRLSSRLPLAVTTGIQLRHDRVALDSFNTVDRRPTAKRDVAGALSPAHTVDAIVQTSDAGLYVDARGRWRRWLRTAGGARLDVIRLQVDEVRGGGTELAAVASPKASATFGPWRGLELFANAGQSFHTNHARGVVQTANPSDPIVRTSGAEVGLAGARRQVQWTAAVWMIRSASELVYVPEEGTTSAERPAQRSGIEATLLVRPRSWLTIDLDLATSSARYRIDPAGEGTRIPDALRGVAGAGVVLQRGRWTTAARVRYLGARPLLADGSVWSRPSSLVTFNATVPVGRRMDLGLDVLNVFDREYEDITYYFATRLKRPSGQIEPGPVADYVTRPGEPRAARARLVVRF